MSRTPEVLEQVFESARVAAEKKGSDLMILNVSRLAGFTDYFLLVSASSDRRVSTIAEAIRARMRELGVMCLGSEGVKEGKWALVDFGSFVVHVFYADLRHVFDLEGFWSGAPVVPLPKEITASSGKAGNDL